MIELLGFVRYVLDLYWWVVILSVVLSWLMAFNVVNPYNPFVRSLNQAVAAVTEPFLRPIRRILPDLGPVDISPVILLIAVVGLKDFFIPFLARMVV